MVLHEKITDQRLPRVRYLREFQGQLRTLGPTVQRHTRHLSKTIFIDPEFYVCISTEIYVYIYIHIFIHELCVHLISFVA